MENLGYTVNPLPDNFALCCSIWSIGFFFKWIEIPKIRYLVVSALFLCLSALAKLPFVLYGSVIFAYIIIEFKNKGFLIIRQNLKISLVYVLFMLPVAIWYIYVIPSWKGNGIVSGILDSAQCKFTMLELLQHNIISTLPELLINYGSLLFFLCGLFFIWKNRAFSKNFFPIFLFWGISIIAYFLFELNMISKVHDYYLFPFLPLIFIIVAYGAFSLLSMKKSLLNYIVLFLFLVLPLTAYLRINSRWNIEDTGFNNDLYKFKNELRFLVPDNKLCVVGNDESMFIFLYYIDKKGWVFEHDNLDEVKLKEWISKGAEYIYMDSKADTVSQIKDLLKEKIFDKGSIRVYKL